jgi:hypothetical protein
VHREATQHLADPRAQLDQHLHLLSVEARESYRAVILRQFIIMLAYFNKGLIHIKYDRPLIRNLFRE